MALSLAAGGLGGQAAKAFALGAFAAASTQAENSDDVSGHFLVMTTLDGLRGLPDPPDFLGNKLLSFVDSAAEAEANELLKQGRQRIPQFGERPDPNTVAQEHPTWCQLAVGEMYLERIGVRGVTQADLAAILRDRGVNIGEGVTVTQLKDALETVAPASAGGTQWRVGDFANASAADRLAKLQELVDAGEPWMTGIELPKAAGGITNHAVFVEVSTERGLVIIRDPQPWNLGADDTVGRVYSMKLEDFEKFWDGDVLMRK